MAYIGNTAQTQAFTPAIDYFSGNGSTTAFTLSRPVASVAQVQAVIENVPQNPSDAFTVSSNTITFTSAPPSGTNNIYVYYTSPITTVATLSQDPVITGSMTYGSLGARIRGLFDGTPQSNRVAFQTSTTNAQTTPIIIPNGTVGSGTTASGIVFHDSTSITTGNGSTGSVVNIQSSEIRLTSGIQGTGTYLPLTMHTGGSERLRVTTAGDVGIGTASPATRLNVEGTLRVNRSGQAAQYLNIYSTGGEGFIDGVNSDSATNQALVFRSGNNSTTTERGRFDTSGNFLFNSGYGSVATAFGCRAWVNFNGTGTPAIRGSGNVTSLTDNGQGDYTVNFTSSMPDVNYSVSGVTSKHGNTATGVFISSQATGNVRVLASVTDGLFDQTIVCVNIFR
jgi:hypothetical protein